MTNPVTDGTLFFPPQASTVAPDVDNLYYYIYYLCVVAFFAVAGAGLYFVYKYRTRPGADNPQPVPISHNTALEVGWSVVPLLFFVSMFAWGFKGYMFMQLAPKDAYEVHVTARKWSWAFEHPNGVTEAAELHVPVNKPVKLIMYSQDVIHSFFVPDFRTKQDVIPGKYTTEWFQATQTGAHQVFCTEYCGTDHSNMLAKVYVMEQGEFDKWLNTQSGPTDEQLKDAAWMAKKGEELFNKNACTSCHANTPASTATIGPKLLGKYGTMEKLSDGATVKVDDDYVRESIKNPTAKVVAGYQPVMPVFGFKDWQVSALLAYIKTLKQ